MKRTMTILVVLLLCACSYQLLYAAETTKGKENKSQSEKKVRLTDIKGLDLTGLSREQQESVKKLLDENQMKYCTTKSILTFLGEDSENALAKQMTQDVIAKVKAGKSEKEILVDVKRSLRSARALPDINIDNIYDINIAGAPYRGPDKAPVTLVEFSDFQCPYCAGLTKILNQIDERYASDVKHVFKNFPLQFHSFARLSAKAAIAAGEQGKFWEMRQKLFDNFKTLSQENINKYATELGLDMDRFQKALNDSKLDALIDADLTDGELVDVTGTPTVYINGKRYTGKRTVDDFGAVIASITGKTPPPPQPPQPSQQPPQQPPQAPPSQPSEPAPPQQPPAPK